MTKHFKGSKTKAQKTANRKSMAVPIVTSQASIIRTLKKQDSQKNLWIKLRFRAKDPIGGNLLTTTTATTGLAIMHTPRTRRSHSIIGLGRCIDFCETGRPDPLSGYVSEMKHVVESRREDFRATQTAAPTRKLRHLNHANPGHYRCSGILPKRSPT